jgi:ribose-phosphate pyrophosphokinase
MSKSIVFALPGNEAMARCLTSLLAADIGEIESRRFPDGEIYLRFITMPQNRSIVLVCTLAHPDDKLLSLLFAASTARELGAPKVGLVAPYLAYMRQDRRFNSGEAVTSRQVAALLSRTFDWLVTVDPHLHRYHALGDIYSIPTRTIHAAPLLSKWVLANVSKPILIGPDAESEQWVAAVAKNAGAPFTVLEKTRHGDRDLDVKLRHADRLPERTPVLIDDIVSSGHTMLEAVRQIRRYTKAPPICLAVHGIFADASDAALLREGARIVTSNTISHPSNEIDVCGSIATAVTDLS